MPAPVPRRRDHPALHNPQPRGGGGDGGVALLLLAVLLILWLAQRGG